MSTIVRDIKTMKNHETYLVQKEMYRHMLNSVYGLNRPDDVPNDAVKEYIMNDIIATNEMFNRTREYNRFRIKKVIFNDPATIVLWKDGTKTVVKCQENEVFDPEKGLAMAMCKKMLGNKYEYYNVFKKWLPKESVEDCTADVKAILEKLRDKFKI